MLEEDLGAVFGQDSETQRQMATVGEDRFYMSDFYAHLDRLAPADRAFPLPPAVLDLVNMHRERLGLSPSQQLSQVMSPGKFE